MDPVEAEVVDVTEDWVQSMRYIDNVQFDFNKPNCIYPESDIKSRYSTNIRNS